MRYFLFTISLCLLLNGISGSACFAGSLYENAVQLYGQKKFDLAATVFEQIIGTETKNANAYYYLGLCYLQSRQYKAAKSMFSDAITRFPETSAAAMAKKALQGLEPSNASTQADSRTRTPDSNNLQLTTHSQSDNLPRQFMVPYTMHGPKYMVNANINGHPLQMCVDTGCDRTIIPIEYIEEIRLEKPSVKYAGHYSSTGAGFWKEQANIQLGPLLRNKLAIEIFDTSSWPGVPLLGNTFFEGFSRSFNSADATLRATREVSQADNALSGSGECLIPFEPDRYRNSPIIDAVINGHTTKVMFDTGGNDSIWITYEEASALGIDPDNGTTQHVGSSRIPCVGLTVDKVQLGKVILEDVKIMIFDKSQATWGTDIVCFGSTMLGEYGYNFIIDNKTKVIRIRKQ